MSDYSLPDGVSTTGTCSWCQKIPVECVCDYQTDPIDLRTSGFPTWVYPPPAQRFIESVARAIPVPVQFMGTAILPTAAVAIGSKRSLIVSVDSDFIEPCIVWVLLVGESGCGKSPVLEIAARPLVRIDSDYYDEYVEQRELWLARSKKDREDAPHRRPLIRTDATIETLTHDLKISKAILGLFDEGRELTGQFQGYSPGRQESNRAKYLQLFGGRRLDRRRMGQDEGGIDILINNPRVSLLGGIQPSGLGKLLTRQGDDDDGMVYRFLLTPGSACDEEGEGHITDADWYEAAIRSFFCLPERHMELSSDALLLLKGTVRRWRKEGYRPEIIAKMKDYISRVALVLGHYWMYFEEADRDITLEDLERAVEICQWHLDSYYQVEDKLIARSDGKLHVTTLDALRSWLLRQSEKRGTDRIPKRDIARAQVAGIVDVRLLDSALANLRACGEIELDRDGRKDIVVWKG